MDDDVLVRRVVGAAQLGLVSALLPMVAVRAADADARAVTQLLLAVAAVALALLVERRTRVAARRVRTAAELSPLSRGA